VNDGPSEDDEDTEMLKSSSIPNLDFHKNANKNLTSRSNSEMSACELQKQQQLLYSELDPEGKQLTMQAEAQILLIKARQAARMQMEVECQCRLKRSAMEEIISFSLNKRKFTRAQLTKMCIGQLQIIMNDLHSKIQAYNEELVNLLVDRDSLHMEQDSKLVDVQDIMQHQSCKHTQLPEFLANVLDVNSNNGLGKTGGVKLKFNFFKRMV